MDNLPLEMGSVDFVEHSKHSRAKKVVVAPVFIPPHATVARTIDGVRDTNASASLTVLRNKAYRVISDGAINFRLSNDGSTAANTDAYFPANQAFVIASREYNSFDFLRTGGSFIQIIEVQ